MRSFIVLMALVMAIVAVTMADDPVEDLESMDQGPELLARQKRGRALSKRAVKTLDVAS